MKTLLSFHSIPYNEVKEEMMNKGVEPWEEKENRERNNDGGQKY
jgi:hypothetical protein